MAQNECIPFYEDGDAITADCVAPVVGKTFVMIAGSRPYGPGFILSSTDTSGGNVQVQTATAGGRKFGVAAFDQAAGRKVTVLRSPGIVVPVTSGAAITAFAEVMVGAGGLAIPFVVAGSNVAVGYVITACNNGDDAQVHLY